MLAFTRAPDVGVLFSPLTNIQGHSQEPQLRTAAILLGTPTELLITSKEALNTTPAGTQNRAMTVFLKA